MTFEERSQQVTEDGLGANEITPEVEEVVGIAEGAAPAGPSPTPAPTATPAYPACTTCGPGSASVNYFSVSGLINDASVCNVDISDGFHNWWNNGKKQFLATGSDNPQQRHLAGQMRYETGGNRWDWGYNNLCGQQNCWTFACKPTGKGGSHHIAYAVSDSDLPPTTGWQTRSGMLTGTFTLAKCVCEHT